MKYLITALLLSSCVTTKGSSNKSGKAASKISGETVVVQPFAKSPIISDKPNSYWMTLRKSGATDLAKMQGLLATGEWQAAVDTARNYLVKRPGNPEAMMGMACGYAVGRRYELAGYYAALVLKIQPANSDAMNIIGLRRMMATGNRRADYQDAITWFQKSLDADGTQIAAGLNLGHLMLEMGDNHGSYDAFSTTVTRCDNCERGLLGLGMAAARSGRGEDAESAFERALSKNSSFAEAKYHLAMNYRNNLKDPNKATKLMQEIVSDADGRFANEAAVKRQATIALRRLKGTDRPGDLRYATQKARSHSKAQDALGVPVSEEPEDDED